MDGISFFLTHALITLIPLIAAGFGLGLWLGWMLWYRWKKEYSAVETDFHKLYDHHDAASAAITSLENVRGTLTSDQEKLKDLLEKFKEANDGYAAEYNRLETSLAATQRNSRDLEEMWRKKLADAQSRISALEASLAGKVGNTPQESAAAMDIPKVEQTAEPVRLAVAPPEEDSAETQNDETFALTDEPGVIPFPQQSATPATPPPAGNSSGTAPAKRAPAGKGGKRQRSRAQAAS